MATNAFGMFSFGAEDKMRQDQIAAQQTQAMNYARLTPQQQSSYNMSMGAQTVGQGVGDLVRQGVGMLSGQDTSNPQEKLARMRAQLQQELGGIDPASDPMQAYPILIRVLQQNGMIAEAQDAMRQFEDLKNAKETKAISRAEHERKLKKDEQDARIAQAKLDIQRPGSPMMQLLNEKQRLEEKKAVGGLTAAEENKLVGINAAMDDRKIQLADRGNMIEVVIDGVPTGRTMPKAASPDAELRTASSRQATEQLQSIYDAQDAVALAQEAQSLIAGSTGSLLGAARDQIYAAFGVSTPEAAKLAQLKVLAGTLLSKFERLPGPVSDFEMKSYQQANGDLASATTPNTAKAAAVATMMKLFQARLARAQERRPAARTSNTSGGNVVDFSSLK